MVTESTRSTPVAGARGLARLWRRDLATYPDTGYRSFLLALAVLSNVVLTWTVTAGGAAAPVALAHFHMSLTYYSYLLVVSGSIGALSSYVSSFGDRWGRANLVVIGLLVNSVFALLALPEAPNKISYAILTCVLAFADGAIFVGTPALVRDFSPQMQRGLAMGFWTFGPVAGALVTSSVAHAVLPAVATFANWQELFRIGGAAGVVTFVVMAIFLRELSAPLRSQRMAQAQERTLVELRARGLDLQTAMSHRWHQMLKWDLVLSAFAINFFLLIYFTASSYLVFYMTSVMHFSLNSFNGLQQLYWGVNVVALVVFGYLSDRLRVRKPFMLLGSVVVIAMILIFMRMGPGTSYSTFAIELSVMAAFLGCCYCPWFASFTETIEAHNPALIATGTSLYGFATRAVLAPFGLVFPAVVSAYNGFIDNSAYLKYARPVTALLKAHGPLIAAVQHHAALFARLARYHPATSAPPALLAQAARAVGGVANLVELGKLGPQLALLKTAGPHLQAIQAALAAEPHQWNHWFYACIGGIVVFIPMIFALVGRWSPAKAKQDLDEHEAAVQRELVLLEASQAVAAPTG